MAVIEPTLQNEADTVMVGIDDLIIGRPIQTAIHDENGVLLLAEGSVITAEFKRLLRQHKLPEVRLAKDDAARVTLSSNILEDVEPFSFDTALTQELDRIVDGGIAPVRNTGPSVRDGMVSLGRNGYDAKQRDRLVARNEHNRAAMSSMMQDALDGGKVDGAIATEVASNYFNEMRSDVENVLTSTVGIFDDDCLSQQSIQTSLLSMALGIELGLDAENVRTIGTIGLVHDWGMMKVPKRVREAPKPLSNDDFFEIKKHPIYSLELLNRTQSIPGIASLVAYQIHERPNGTGYPRGRSGASIHQFARIIAVADTYTAMTAKRHWRKPFMAYAAMEMMLRETQKKNLDAQVVRALLQVLSLFPVGSLVTLSDSSIARVIRRNGKNYTRPIVQVLQSADGGRVDTANSSGIIDLASSDITVVQAIATPGRDELSLNEAIELIDTV